MLTMAEHSWDEQDFEREKKDKIVYAERKMEEKRDKGRTVWWLVRRKVEQKRQEELWRLRAQNVKG